MKAQRLTTLFNLTHTELGSVYDRFMKISMSKDINVRHIRDLTNVLGIVLGKIRRVAKKSEKRYFGKGKLKNIAAKSLINCYLHIK